MPRGWVGLHRVAWLALLFACLLGAAEQVAAARVAVVLSDESAPYEEIYQAIRARLASGSHEASRLHAGGLAASSLGEARLAVAVGVRAAEALAGISSRPPVLAVLVPRAWYLKSGRARLSEGDRQVSAIYLDQPFERQARLIRLALPDVRRVGVLLGADQEWLTGELDEALRTHALMPVHETLGADERLIRPLEKVLAGSDLLLAVPDPRVFNRNTAQSLFLTSYRYRVPVMGYSQSLTRAGALLSLHSSPAQIGREAAEWVSSALQGPTVRLPPPAYPAYAGVSVNEQVARSLGLVLPPEGELERRMGGER
jgi:ABC-type uncharacterized transport system substrate-binding protein